MSTKKNQARSNDTGPKPDGVPSPFTTPGNPTPNEGADRAFPNPPMDRRSGLDRREVNDLAAGGATKTDMD
jgi:hypothetical protein